MDTHRQVLQRIIQHRGETRGRQRYFRSKTHRLIFNAGNPDATLLLTRNIFPMFENHSFSEHDRVVSWALNPLARYVPYFTSTLFFAYVGGRFKDDLWLLIPRMMKGITSSRTGAQIPSPCRSQAEAAQMWACPIRPPAGSRDAPPSRFRMTWNSLRRILGGLPRPTLPVGQSGPMVYSWRTTRGGVHPTIILD